MLSWLIVLYYNILCLTNIQHLSTSYFCFCVAAWWNSCPLTETLQMFKYFFFPTVDHVIYVSVSHPLQHVKMGKCCRLTKLFCYFELLLFFSLQQTHHLTGAPIRCLTQAGACSLTHVEASLPAETVVLSLQTPE